jgi:hypothetical protein
LRNSVKDLLDLSGRDLFRARRDDNLKSHDARVEKFNLHGIVYP